MDALPAGVTCAAGQAGGARHRRGADGVGPIRQLADARTRANGIFNPDLDGGALAHLGPYPLSLAQWLFGTPTLTQAIGATGADEDVAFQLLHPGDVIGSFFVSVRAWGTDEFQVMGTDGRVGVRGTIFRPHGLDLAQEPPQRSETAGFGWRARLRQPGLVHQIAQRLGRSSRSGSRRIAPLCRQRLSLRGRRSARLRRAWRDRERDHAARRPHRGGGDDGPDPPGRPGRGSNGE